MEFHRHSRSTRPFEITFDQNDEYKIRETVVAAEALSMSGYDQDQLNLDDSQVDRCSALALRIGNTEIISGVDVVCLDLDEVKTLGSALINHIDRTDDDIARMQYNNTPSRRGYSYRRVESLIAMDLLSSFDKRISIVRMVTPPEIHTHTPWHER